ncbi:MAG: ABC-F family ATP-binding cassette domain-containing protein [Alphaproteobacteria bacterium]
MLHINDLTYRVEGRLLFDGATASVPTGHKVGLVGRNGTGKTTLLNLIAGELSPDGGGTSLPRASRIGMVRQEAPGDQRRLIDFVLEADVERTALLAESETAQDPHRIAEIQLRLTDIGAFDAPARAAIILAGLEFDEAAQMRPLAEFSGGWRMRVALAALLFSQPDLLLLDEPTNYLDLEGALWLETYLKRYPHTVVMVSHDRDLLNRAVTGILHLDQRQLTYYSGGYDRFERTRRERQALQLNLKRKQDDARRHMETYINRFRAQASKARQAQSRIKALERMQPIPDLIEDRIKPFYFPSPEKQLAPPLLVLEDVVAGYGDDAIVLRKVNLRLDSDDRIGLLGANGNGKSTLAKLLAKRLAPMAGVRRGDRRMRIGFFAQHQLDELTAGDSPYDHVRALMPDATQAQVRGRLGALGFGADTADTPAQRLSGGEKARLLFGIATFHKPHLLILDEPTNHLDVESRETLVHALNDYEGAVILISHDRHLVEAVADRLWLVDSGTVTPFDGDMDDYREVLRARRRARDRAVKPADEASGEPAPPRQKTDKAARRRAAAQAREALAPLKKACRTGEALVAAHQGKIAGFDAQLAQAGLFEDYPQKAKELTQQRGAALRDLRAAEAAWLAAEETYEAARSAALPVGD